jgi:hypothetical protein
VHLAHAAFDVSREASSGDGIVASGAVFATSLGDAVRAELASFSASPGILCLSHRVRDSPRSCPRGTEERWWARCGGARE